MWIELRLHRGWIGEAFFEGLRKRREIGCFVGTDNYVRGLEFFERMIMDPLARLRCGKGGGDFSSHRRRDMSHVKMTVRRRPFWGWDR